MYIYIYTQFTFKLGYKIILKYFYILYSGDEDDIEAIKHLSPFETKQRMKTKLDSMDLNKNGIIEKNELTNKLFESYK